MHISRLKYLSAKPTIEGMLTFLPGLENLLNRKTGGTDSARYCYSVWLRHSVKLFLTLNADLSGAAIAEIGPGDSLGTGIAALLSGCRSYTAIDSVQHFNRKVNLAVLDEIYAMFKRKLHIPDHKEFPLVKPLLQNYDFPLFLNEVSETLTIDKQNQLAKALETVNTSSTPISYMPVDAAENAKHSASLNFIFSQAVMEHIDDLSSTYAVCRRWLKTGGLMSHTIDFKCHGSSRHWNGHWTYPSWLWRILLGRRKYFINRQPLSCHLDLLKQNGFSIILLEKYHQNSTLLRDDLAPEFRHLTDDDLNTSGAYILARKND
jgi:hypothetical protein